MEKLQDSELLITHGGAAKKAILFLLLGLGALVTGIVDGLLRPLKCNS